MEGKTTVAFKITPNSDFLLTKSQILAKLCNNIKNSAKIYIFVRSLIFTRQNREKIVCEKVRRAGYKILQNNFFWHQCSDKKYQTSWGKYINLIKNIIISVLWKTVLTERIAIAKLSLWCGYVRDFFGRLHCQTFAAQNCCCRHEYTAPVWGGLIILQKSPQLCISVSSTWNLAMGIL